MWCQWLARRRQYGEEERADLSDRLAASGSASGGGTIA